jgi:hypothetical protein
MSDDIASSAPVLPVKIAVQVLENSHYGQCWDTSRVLNHPPQIAILQVDTKLDLVMFRSDWQATRTV